MVVSTPLKNMISSIGMIFPFPVLMEKILQSCQPVILIVIRHPHDRREPPHPNGPTTLPGPTTTKNAKQLQWKPATITKRTCTKGSREKGTRDVGPLKPGWWFQPLENILVKWDDYSQYMGK